MCSFLRLTGSKTIRSWWVLVNLIVLPEFKMVLELKVKWDHSTKTIHRKCSRVLKSSVKHLTKCSTTSKTQGRSGRQRVEPLTTRSSLAKTSASIRLHLDSITTRSSTGRALSSMCPVQANINMVLIRKYIKVPSPKTR